MNYSKVGKPMMLAIPCYLKLIAILKLLPVHWVSNIRGQHFTPVILISLAHAFDCKLKQKSDITFIASSFNVRLNPFRHDKNKILHLDGFPFVTFAVLLSTRSIIFKHAFHWSMQFKVFWKTLRL